MIFRSNLKIKNILICYRVELEDVNWFQFYLVR